MPQQHTGTVLYYADSKPSEQYDTFSVGVTPDDSNLIPQGKKCLYINEKDGRADYLCSLKKGDRVIFYESGRGRIGPYYTLLETNSQGGFATEDPVVEEILGQRLQHPAPPRSNAPQPAPTFAKEPTLATEPDLFGSWSADAINKMAILYVGLRDLLGDGEVATRDLQKMAVSLYIQYNMDKPR